MKPDVPKAMVKASTETALRELEEKRRQAMLASDLETLRALLDTDLVYTHSNGSSDTRDSYLAKLTNAEISYQRIDLDIHQVSAGMHFALLAGSMDADILVSGKPLHVQSHYEAVWKRAQGGWAASAIRSYVPAPP